MKLDVLIFAAHPDDAELACAGTILSLIDEGKTNTTYLIVILLLWLFWEILQLEGSNIPIINMNKNAQFRYK